MHETLFGGVVLDDFMRVKDRDAVGIWLRILDFMNVFQNGKIELLFFSGVEAESSDTLYCIFPWTVL